MHRIVLFLNITCYVCCLSVIEELHRNMCCSYWMFRAANWPVTTGFPGWTLSIIGTLIIKLIKPNQSRHISLGMVIRCALESWYHDILIIGLVSSRYHLHVLWQYNVNTHRKHCELHVDYFCLCQLAPFEMDWINCGTLNLIFFPKGNYSDLGRRWTTNPYILYALFTAPHRPWR